MTNTDCGVYKIKNLVTGQAYIGSSFKISSRRNAHFNDLRSNRHRNIRLQRSFNKHGEHNFEFSTIVYVPESRLLTVEQNLLDEYGIKNLYNICPTAGNHKGRIPSDKTRALWSRQRKGMKHSPESRLKAQIAFKLQGGHPHKRKIKQIDSQTGDLIKIWPSIYSAADALKLKGEHISAVCNKTPQISKTGGVSYRRTVGGYHWCFYGVDITESFPIIKRDAPSKAVVQIDMPSGTIINVFPGVNEAAKHTTALNSKICSVCKGKRKSAGGYHWKYLSDIDNIEFA